MKRPMSVLLAALAITLLTVPAAGASATPPPDEQRLEDNHLYYQGTTLVRADYAPTNVSEAALYTRSGSHVRNISLQNGDLKITGTVDMNGRYYVTAAGAPRIDFEVAPEGLDITTSRLRLAEDPLRPTIRVEVGASLYQDGEYHVTAGIPDFATRVSGDGVEVIDDDTIRITGSATFTLDLSGVEARDHAIHAKNPDSPAEAHEIFELPQSYIPPEADTWIQVERGGSYWQFQALAVNDATVNALYTVESIAGDQVATARASTSGTVYLNPDEWGDGVYRVVNANQSEVTRFEIRVQSLTASITDDILTVGSNRGGYAVMIRIANDSQVVTERVLANASGNATTLNDLGEHESIELDTSTLTPGDYTVSVTAVDSQAVANTSFSVAVPQTTTATTSSTAEATPTKAQSTTSGTTQGMRTTDMTSTPQPTTGETGGGSPGFDTLGGVLAVVAAGVLALREYDREG